MPLGAPVVVPVLFCWVLVLVFVLLLVFPPPNKFETGAGLLPWVLPPNNEGAAPPVAGY